MQQLLRILNAVYVSAHTGGHYKIIKIHSVNNEVFFTVKQLSGPIIREHNNVAVHYLTPSTSYWDVDGFNEAFNEMGE